MKKIFKRVTIIILVLGVIAIIASLAIDKYVRNIGSAYIMRANDVQNADAILVLGAYVFPNGTISTMLNDRLIEGLELYKNNKAKKFIVSGDHGKQNYDEVNAMKKFLLLRGVKNEDVFMDHAGFSTYESLYRARDIFKAKKVIIVTQKYHLMRAVFIAREMGLEAYGVSSDRQDYGTVMKKYELREIAARVKDFFNASIIKPKPKYLGKEIPVIGNGIVTNDKFN